MLWAAIKEDGTLELRPGDSLESFALRSWERMHKSGKAKIVINTDKMYSLQEIASLLKKDLVSMQRWKAEQAGKVISATGLADG